MADLDNTKCALCGRVASWEKFRGINKRHGHLTVGYYKPQLTEDELYRLKDGEHEICTDRRGCQRRQQQSNCTKAPKVKHNNTVHAVHATGTAQDGSLYGMFTFCGMQVHDDQKNPDWVEVTNVTVTCKRCIAVG